MQQVFFPSKCSIKVKLFGLLGPLEITLALENRSTSIIRADLEMLHYWLCMTLQTFKLFSRGTEMIQRKKK